MQTRRETRELRVRHMLRAPAPCGVWWRLAGAVWARDRVHRRDVYTTIQLYRGPTLKYDLVRTNPD